MQAFVAFFAPSLIGLKILDNLNNENKKELFFDYIILIISSMFFNNIFSCVFFKVTENINKCLNELPIYFSKYILLSVFVNIVLAFIIIIIKKELFNRIRSC